MLNQRLTGLYEDIGHVLNRYYDIDEAMDAVGKEDGDIDNDGDEDSSDEYLRKRRNAIGKAVKKETKEAPGELDNNEDEKRKHSHGSQHDGHQMSEDKGDMDNDGKDEPDSDEYMDNKDKAIKKAMGKTEESLNKRPIKRLKDMGNVSNGIPALGDIIRNK